MEKVKVIKTPFEEVKAYYESQRVSQSYLKRFDSDPRFINEPFTQSGAEHFVVGQIVDTFLTGEEGDFEKEFFILEADKNPSDAIIGILKSVLELTKEDYEQYKATCITVQNAEVLSQTLSGEEMEEYQSRIVGQEDFFTPFPEFAGELEERETYLVDCARRAEWNTKWGDEAIFKNLVKEGAGYFKILTHSEGKRIVSRETYNKAKTVVDSFRTHPRTSYICNDKYGVLSESYRVTVYYQLICFFEVQGIECKMMADRVTVYSKLESDEIVGIEALDFKTMSGNTFNFPDSVKSWGYHIQGAFYRTGLAKYFEVDESLISFYFAVESTNFPGKPLVFKMSESLLEGGKNGVTMYGKQTKGYMQYLSDYTYYSKNGFEEEPIIRESYGVPLLLEGDFSLSSVAKSLTPQGNETREW